MTILNIKISTIILVLFTLINLSCGPDIADNPINNTKPTDSLVNGVTMLIDGVEWRSNSIAKCQYFPGGIQIDAAYWDSINKITETINFFLKNDNVGKVYKMYPFNENNNFAFFKYFPFSSPLASTSFEANSGNFNLTLIDSIRVKGDFTITLKDSSGKELNITNGKLNIKFLKE